MNRQASDSALRRLFRNAGYLLGGKAVGALLHLASLAIVGRALGPDGFGALVLIHAVAQTASGFASSQTWQAMIKFGTAHLLAGRERSLRDLLLFCVALDVAVGVTAMIIAIAVVFVFGDTFGIPRDYAAIAALYCLLVPTMAASAATGVLRLFDRFGVLAIQGTANPAIRLACVSLAALTGAPFWCYALAWFAADLVGDLLIWFSALRELRHRGLLRLRGVSLRRAWQENAGIGRFVLATNASTSVATLLGPTSTLLVGAVLGPAAAGLYRVSLVLVEAAAKPGDMVTRAFLPEIARLRSAGEVLRFWSVVNKVVLLSLALAGGLVLAFVLFAEPIVDLVFGTAYRDAGSIVAPASLALFGMLPAYFFDAAIVSLGLAGRGLIARCFGAVVLFFLLALLLPQSGLSGAGWAYAAGAMIAGLAAAMMLGRERLHDRARFAAPATAHSG